MTRWIAAIICVFAFAGQAQAMALLPNDDPRRSTRPAEPVRSGVVTLDDYRDIASAPGEVGGDVSLNEAERLAFAMETDAPGVRALHAARPQGAGDFGAPRAAPSSPLTAQALPPASTMAPIAGSATSAAAPTSNWGRTRLSQEGSAWTGASAGLGVPAAPQPAPAQTASAASTGVAQDPVFAVRPDPWPATRGAALAPVAAPAPQADAPAPLTPEPPAIDTRGLAGEPVSRILGDYEDFPRLGAAPQSTSAPSQPTPRRETVAQGASLGGPLGGAQPAALAAAAPSRRSSLYLLDGDVVIEPGPSGCGAKSDYVVFARQDGARSYQLVAARAEPGRCPSGQPGGGAPITFTREELRIPEGATVAVIDAAVE